MKQIVRQTISEQAYRHVLDGIVKGVFSPGIRLKDTEIAGDLGISRTPAREALLRLQQDGFLDGRVGGGFRVRELKVGEIEDLYPILINLEALAVRSSPPAGRPKLQKLRDLNTVIGAAETPPLKRISKDAVWHSTLIDECRNRHLVSMIDHLKTVIQRYLHAYILLMPRIEPSIDHHEKVVTCLEEGKVEAAVKVLEEHWMRNLARLVELLGGPE
jgi:DNA-binding GntR family transcriptional regulator